MSAPLSPAARTRTSNWPSWGSGSGRSATWIRPSTIVAARMSARVLRPFEASVVQRSRNSVIRADSPGKRGRGRPSHSPFSPALARVAPASRRPRCSAARSGAAAACRPARTPGPADPRLPGRRRLARHDDPLAARERLPHAPRRNPHQRGLLAEACGRLEERSSASRRPGERVAIIGQSRGGIFARAWRSAGPDLVSGIVTLGSPTVNQLASHPFVLAQVALVGALGTGPRPRHAPDELPARRVLHATSATTSPRRSRPRSASPRSTRAPTESSTGTPAWTRRPSRSRSAPHTSAWA